MLKFSDSNLHFLPIFIDVMISSSARITEFVLNSNKQSLDIGVILESFMSEKIAMNVFPVCGWFLNKT